MTIENSFTVKAKRTDHPNSSKYPGRPSMEFGRAVTNFLSDIGPENTEDFVAGKYIFEEELSAEFFDSLQEGDVVGLGLLRGLNEVGENEYNEGAAYKFKILEILKDKDIVRARNVTFESKKRTQGTSNYKGQEVELAFEDLSCALGMGFGEILERDGKPFGVPEEIELTIKIDPRLLKKQDEEPAKETQDSTGDSSLGPDVSASQTNQQP